MWVDSFDADCKKVVNECIKLRDEYLKKNPNKQEECDKYPIPTRKYQSIFSDSPANTFPYNACPEKPPCPICGSEKPFYGSSFTEGERYSGASFGTSYTYCSVCGLCYQSKYDEY